MDCPVCQYKGIPESTKKCPNCHSDLTGFRQLYQLRNSIKQKRTIIFSMGFLLVIIIAILGYMLLFSGGLSSRYSRMAIQEKENEIIKLKKQNSQLQKQLLDLQQRLNMQSVGDTTNGGNTTNKFTKVIPSPSEQKKQASTATTRSQKQQQSDKTKPSQADPQEKKTQSEVIRYEVKAGETLYSIAKRHYGDGSKYKKIMKDNNIDDPSEVDVGMVLKIIKE